MKYKSIIYQFLFSLLLIPALSACVDDKLVEPDSDKDIVWNEEDGYCLQFVITLDDMGGVGATRGTISELKAIEDYVDVEKLRVLFFTCEAKKGDDDFDHDYFLFEPKNHWVKKIGAADNYKNENRYLVSVPMYTHGNNEGDYRWDWDFIRERLTTEKFKIAILANRPEYDYADRFAGNGGVEKIAAGWMPNKGPYWGSNDAFTKGDEIKSLENLKEKGVKDVFDLHHCQVDINYINKSAGDGYYSFIMDDWGNDWYSTWDGMTSDKAKRNEGPKMGATSSWVNWDLNFGTDSTDGLTIYNEEGFVGTANTKAYSKTSRLPSYDYPIPMYGIQEFDPITYSEDDDNDEDQKEELWLKGSPFYLSPGIPGQDELDPKIYNQKTISILRSVVRMELLIPKTGYTEDDLKMVAVCYSNIYSRCEPMNVWTPTDILWNNLHGTDANGKYTGDNKCEIENILKYGSICTTNQKFGTNIGAVEEYQTALRWFYGAWEKKGWKFNGYQGRTYNVSFESPNLFNPVIQRNQLVICGRDSKFDDGDYWHYVYYCGERNIMDPSNLDALHSPNPANNTCQYWMIQLGDNVYAIPVTDYSKSNNTVHNLTAIQPSKNGSRTKTSYFTKISYIANHQAADATTKNQNSWNTFHNDYESSITALTTSADPSILPWPLIRNHVYRITLSRKSQNNGSASGRSTDDSEPVSFKISCEDLHSKSI